ncbi:MAG: CRISPR-associated endonuclease Cas2 [Patescibacteria group bacterium]|nr:CRISPR-associated endonuclease Cas2 [Patescibacteria group bacterium]
MAKRHTRKKQGETKKDRKSPMEDEVKHRARRGSIERAVIGTLLVGGMLTVGIMAPKVLGLMRKEHVNAVLPQDPKQRLRETLWRLKRKGMVAFEKRGDKNYPYLTKRGVARAEHLKIGSVSIPKPFRWDRRWRIVIFDIPQDKSALRDRIRSVLLNLGFYKLQHSVWVHPHDCEEIVALLKLNQGVHSEVLYIIADAIEYDRPIREHFSLPQD